MNEVVSAELWDLNWRNNKKLHSLLNHENAVENYFPPKHTKEYIKLSL